MYEDPFACHMPTQGIQVGDLSITVRLTAKIHLPGNPS